MSSDTEQPDRPPIERPEVERYEPGSESGPILDAGVPPGRGGLGLGGRIRLWLTLTLGAAVGVVLFVVILGLALVCLVPLLLAGALIRLAGPRGEPPSR